MKKCAWAVVAMDLRSDGNDGSIGSISSNIIESLHALFDQWCI